MSGPNASGSQPGPPPGPPPPVPQPSGADVTGGVIPYRNLPALVGYYLGIFSLIPCVGLLLGIPAVVLGILGLRKAGRQPEVKGKVHAWVGIVVGGLSVLAHILFVLVLFVVPALR